MSAQGKPCAAVDEAAHRLARGVEHADHAAVEGRHNRPGAALDGAFHDVEQVVGPVRYVDMRIFLEQHQSRGVAQRTLTDIAMQIELDADRHVRTDDLADMGQHVSSTMCQIILNKAYFQPRISLEVPT